MGSHISKTEYYNKLEQIRINNPNIAKAYDYFDHKGIITPKMVEEFLDKMPLSPEEFIYFIALWRKHSDGELAGNTMEAALEFIVEDYRNTPWKFVEEFLQNADDCEYNEKPQIDIIVDSNNKTIEFVYNEKGFSAKDIWALTQFRKSNKPGREDIDYLLESDAEGLFYNEKTGRKGIGFKSVFALPAENVIVHIRSNGYAFMLNKKINAIVPVWEEGYIDDGKTHVIVELENPQFNFRLTDIYPHMRELFCMDDSSTLFMDSPILFMHRIKEVRVKNINKNGVDFFKTGIHERTSSMVYGNVISSNGKVLSAVCHNGDMRGFQWGEIEIYLYDNKGVDITVPAVRYGETKKVDGFWRLFTIIAPVLFTNKKEWKGGSLFRTFPVFDHQYDIPFAMDIPFELNSARKGVDFTNLHKTFNKRVYDEVFDFDEGVLLHFLERLRSIPNIAIDGYFSRKGAVLFDTPDNRYDGRMVLPIMNLGIYLEAIPLFPMFLKTGYISYRKLICVDSSLLSWPYNDSLMTLLLDEKRNLLVAEKYMTSDLLERKRNSVFNDKFIDAINNYLDILEESYGLNSDQFKVFLERKFFPFLISNKEAAIRIDAFKKIRFLIIKKYSFSQTSYIREKYQVQSIWLDSIDLDSVNRYRTVSSLFASTPALLSVLKNEFNIYSADYVFSREHIIQKSRELNSWENLREYLESVFYYGFSLTGIKFKLLDGMVISSEIDADYNPFRDAGIVDIIPVQDIKLLAAAANQSVGFIVKTLKAAGLRDGKDFFVPSGGFLVLNQISTILLETLKNDDLGKCLDNMDKIIRLSGKKLDLSYESIRGGQEALTIFFLANSGLIAAESYLSICEECLRNDLLWMSGTNESAEILIRAVNRARNQDINTNYILHIDLYYLLENKLSALFMKAVENKGFSRYISINNNGYFDRLATDQVLNEIAVHAPDKLEMQKGMHFFAGNLHAFGEKKQYYLIDNSSHSIYLHLEKSEEYIESLLKYLKSPYDEEKVRYSNEFRKQTKKVYEQIIAPVLNGTDHDLDRAFDEIEAGFKNYTKEQVIKIIGWFRYNSYAKSLGGASISHEKEIEDDYKEEPWRFVYEFLQNVDDCIFRDGDAPWLSINIDETDNTISFEYNEIGFQLEDIKALTAFGSSEKAASLEKIYIETGLFDLEKTGRKGRGFKSVFALPGKDIKVHIRSNGYTFKFIKCFGEIIPIWEKLEDADASGTRIIVEGFHGNSIQGIYSSLLNAICAGERKEFFAKSPFLYLRKLKKVTISNGAQRFEMDIEDQKQHFSKERFDKGKLRVVSGIVEGGVYKKSYSSNYTIVIKNTGRKDLRINVLRLSKMEEIVGEARLVSIIAPIIKEKDKLIFDKGALYRTLPLNENTFNIPLAINAPYKVNSGRSSVLNESSRHNDRINALIFGVFICDFYKLIRSIPNIAVDYYIYEKDAQENKLFEGLLYVDSINMETLTRSIPLLRLYSGNGFVSCNDSKMLTHECYTWFRPDYLANTFLSSEEDRLIEERYTSRKIAAGRIIFIDSEFHNRINKYISYCQSNMSDDFWSLLEEKIIPFIGNNFERLNTVYHGESKDEDLKCMNVFPYTTYKNEKRLGNLSGKYIWLNHCKSNYKSFGSYRVLSSAPIHYSDQTLLWMGKLTEILDYDEAFKEEHLKLDKVSSWKDLKNWIEIFIYYSISPSFKITYLARCALDKALSPIKNLFRESFIESGDKDILDFCIGQGDIDEILSEMDGYGNASQKQIINLIRDLGLKEEDDYFSIHRGLASFKPETLSLFKNYCKNQERAHDCILSVKKAYKKLEAVKNLHGIQMTYSEVKHCRSVLITEIMKQKLMKPDYLAHFAEEVFEESSALIQNTDFVEMILVSLSLLNREKQKGYKIKIKLSDILDRQIASYVKEAMVKGYGKNVYLNILRDINTEPYESREVKKSLMWMQDSETQNESSIEKYEYYTGPIKRGFSKDKKGYFLVDSDSVILDYEDISSNLLEFVRVLYSASTDGDLFSGLIRIISIQNELTGDWGKSKQAYVERLAEFREETQKYIDFLCPDYQKNINQATGKMEEFLIPELLQNINDCHGKNKDGERVLHIILNNREMILSYDENGFDYSDVYSITAYGQSTKHDEREGEKGLGFKKVFAVFPLVEIYSNGFAFSLSKEKATVPKWIDDEEKRRKYLKDGKTTMVFKVGTLQGASLVKIRYIWETALTNPGQAGLLLALKNIDRYYFNYPEGKYQLSRGDLLNHYYQAEVPLLALYKMLLKLKLPEPIVADRIHALKADLKKRKKCAVMDEQEFESYVNNLPISLYIPKESQSDNSGLLYSTLPTSRSLGADFFINVPLELSTGRNEILDNSAFNQAIWKAVFKREGTDYSVINYLLCSLVSNCEDLDLYSHFNGSVERYIETISQGDQSQSVVMRKELDCIPIFRAYPNGEPVSLCNAYTVEKIVYDYLYSNAEIVETFDEWLDHRYPQNKPMKLLEIKDGDRDVLEEINGLANSIGEDVNRFPMKIGDEYMSISYFEHEYGVLGGSDE